jgi:hypothetical protein
MIAEAAKRLMSGTDGAEVVEFLRRELLSSAEKGRRDYSVNSLKTYVSHAKRNVLEADYRNMRCDFGPLMAFSDPEVTAFLAAPLKRQLEIQRHHRAHPSWSEEMEDALASLRLLPPNMATFKITDREIRLIKRRDKRSMRERMDSVIVVEDGVALLERATELLATASEKDGYIFLIAPLLLVSGRREVEVLAACAGRSTFTKVGETTVLFEGQCKSKGAEAAPYVIPLLCGADVFIAAIGALRRKRGDLSGMTNEEIHKKMTGLFTQEALRQVFPMLPEEGCKWHTLRSLYLQYVNVLYNHTVAINRLGKLCLGHFDENESVRYLSTRIDGMDAVKGRLGALDLAA